MYMEIDEDDDADDDHDPLTCIKHVIFTSAHAPNDIYRVNQVNLINFEFISFHPEIRSIY